jgi:hypothetical protein
MRQIEKNWNILKDLKEPYHINGDVVLIFDNNEELNNYLLSIEDNSEYELSLEEFTITIDDWILKQLKELWYDSVEEVALYTTIENVWKEEAIKVNEWLIYVYQLVYDGERELDNITKLDDWLQDNQN